MKRLSTFVLAAFVLLAGCTAPARHERRAFRDADDRRSHTLAEALRGLNSNDNATRPEHMPDGTLSLEVLLLEAELRSPRLEAAFQNWRASVAGITTSTAIPDATLSYRYFMNSIDARVGPVEHMLMLEQMVPNPGKLSARQRAAASGAAGARAGFESTRLSVREQVAIAYADVQALDARVTVTARIAELLRDVEGVVEARVRTNLARQSALLRLQVEAERLESEAATLGRRRPALIAALAAASGLNIAPDAQLTPLPEDRPAALPERARLVALALDHPSVQTELAKRAVASARVDEAGWMWVPDLMFGVEYMVMDRMDGAMSDSGRHGIGFMAGITIPWQVHVNAARGDKARAEELAARHLVEQQRLELAARLEAQMYAHDDANRLLDLYAESVLPKARQTLELVRADFTTDRATLTDVLDAERALLAAELSLINARADLQKARARLAALAARNLEDLE